MRFTDETSKSKTCRFGDAQIYYFMHILYESKKMSLYKMSVAMDIEKSAVKSIEDILKEWELISVDRSGIRLTDAGVRFLEDIPIKLVQLPYSKYVIGKYQQGLLVKGVASKITNGMYQRDGAIIAGAEGASIFTMEGGRIFMPKAWDMDDKDPEFAGIIREQTRMEDSDLLIITGASDEDTAIISAISVGLDIL